MDPLSIIGSLIAIIQVSSKIIGICYEYRAVAKSARRDIAAILDETVAVRTLIERLIILQENSDDEALPSLKIVNKENALLQKCLEELSDLKSVLKIEEGLKSRMVPLRWPLKQKEVEGRLVALGRIKATLQMAIGADTAENTVKILAHTALIPDVQKSLTRFSDSIESAAERERKVNLLAKMPARNMVPRHRDHSAKRIGDTGNWVIKHETYETWSHRTGSLLWLSGAAGSGKTVLCSRIVEDLQTKYHSDQSVAVLYFYIDGSDHQPLDIGDIFCSFASQLAQQLPGVPHQLDTHFRHCEPEAARRKEWQSLYENLTKEFAQIYIVIDALDECQEFIELEDMLQALTELMEQKMQVITALVSSRPLDQIQRYFQELGALHISMENDAVAADMETALREQLSGTMPFKRWPQSLRKSTENTLLARASGSFYWIACQLVSLKRSVTPAAVRNCLNNLPKTLENHYLHELEHLETHLGQSLRNIFRWVALSFRPLSTTELAEAIAINVEDQQDPFLDENLELFDIDSFLDSCSSFLSTYRDIKDVKCDQTVYVRFAHFSVLEFLRSDALKRIAQSKLTLEGGLVHAMLAKSCLVYLHQHAVDDADDPGSNPVFRQYAASSWLRHKQSSDDSYWSCSSAQEILYKVFDTETSTYKTWLKYTALDKPWQFDSWTTSSWDKETQSYKTTKSRPYTDTTPLYAASYAGLTEVVTKLLASEADPNAKCGMYAFALQAAAAQGHVETVKHLVAAGADPNALGGKSGSAIAAASTNGHIEIVRILLEAGSKVQPGGRYISDRSDDSLFMAVKGGYLDIVNLLLDHGARDWHEMKGRPPTSFSAAIQSGRIDIVRAMMKYEHIYYTNTTISSVNTSGMNEGLYSAATQGAKEILRELADEFTAAKKLRYAARAGDEQLFSDALASVTSLDDDGSYGEHPRALQSAARGGHLAIVQKLLAAGIDPNRGQHWSTPLKDSVQGGNLEVAKVLIEAGAHVDHKALSAAMYGGRKDFMELFVAHGADTKRCLYRTVYAGEFRDFKIVLELGADIYARDLEPDDPLELDISLLQAAAFGGSVRIIQYLLDHGLVLGDATQTHPLTEAIRCGHLEAARFLLNRGADVNVLPTTHKDPGDWGGIVIHGNCWPPRAAYDTPLSAALHNSRRNQSAHKAGKVQLAHELLDRGALPDPHLSETCGTPLLFAVWEEELDIVRRLLKQGALSNRPGTILGREKLSYPLLLAAEKGNNEILTILLEAGADVDKQDSQGFSATHIASGCSNTNCIRTLVHTYKANITVCLQNGSQPIHSAASRGSAEHVQILVDAGADINARNGTGRTPLHWAADAENCEVVGLLLDMGADATVTADDGEMTAWDLMCSPSQKPWYPSGDCEERSQMVTKMKERLREALVESKEKK